FGTPAAAAARASRGGSAACELRGLAPAERAELRVCRRRSAAPGAPRPADNSEGSGDPAAIMPCGLEGVVRGRMVFAKTPGSPRLARPLSNAARGDTTSKRADSRARLESPARAPATC